MDLVSKNTKDDLPESIVSALRDVCGERAVALHEPCFSGNEWNYTKDCIDSTFVSSVGKYVDRFEAELADYTGARYAIAVVNGTAALHVALILAGVQPGDEVLMPALTFVATANATRYCGAIPHFVDSHEDTLGLDPVALRNWLLLTTDLVDGVCFNRQTGRAIRVVLPMHTFGHPCDLDGLAKVAQEFKLVIVEDAAESLGSYYKGHHTGTKGLLGSLSFNGNKTITTGGGGAILTNDVQLARRAKHITTTAKTSKKWIFEHDEVGYNYRMPNINAALGCAQLEQLPGFMSAKRRLFERYHERFSGVPKVRLMEEPKGSESNYWLQTLVLETSAENQRDSILELSNEAGFATRPVWTLMNRLLPYQDCPKAPLPVATSLERRLINIPSSAWLA
ncbi:LegC family aminotransferase [Amylibacter sp.]|nr:LegC family aminotransferase [Amylibacter sp.]